MKPKQPQATPNRRQFLRISGTALASGVLAACGTTASTATSPTIVPVASTADVASTLLPTTTGATTQPTIAAVATAPAVVASKTLRIWHNWGGVWQEAIQQVATSFSQANPQYTVDILPNQNGAEGLTKFLAAVAAGNPPDLFTTSAVNGASLLNKGVLLPVEPYLSGSTIRKEDFFPDQLDYYTRDNQLYGVPSIEGAAGQAIIWNKGHFAEAGLDPEVGPASFDEIVAFSDKLTKLDSAGSIERLGFDPRDARGNDLLGWWFEREWYDATTQQLRLTSDDMVWGADWVVDFARRVGPDKLAAFRQQYKNWTNDPQSGFVKGAQSMVMSGYYVPGELAKLAPTIEAGYTWVPTRDNKKVSTIYGWFWVMPKGGTQADDAWKFVEHASTVESINTLYATAGGYPSYKPFLETADFSTYNGLQWFIDSTFKAQDFYRAPPLPIAASEVADRLKAGMDEMSFGRIDAKAMLARVQEEAQALVTQEMQKQG